MSIIVTDTTPSTDASDREACRVSMAADKGGNSEVFRRRIDTSNPIKAVIDITDWTNDLEDKRFKLVQLCAELDQVTPETLESERYEMLTQACKLRLVIQELNDDLAQAGIDFARLFRRPTQIAPPLRMEMADKWCPVGKHWVSGLVPDGPGNVCGECLEGKG